MTTPLIRFPAKGPYRVYAYTGFNSPVPKDTVLVAKLTTKSLLALYNEVAGLSKPVARFSDILTGQRRTWAALEAYAERHPEAVMTVGTGPIQLPKRGMALLQDDGVTYAFNAAPRVPRSARMSLLRMCLLALLRTEPIWATVRAFYADRTLFDAVTSVTCFLVTTGYGLVTQPDGRLLLVEPLKEEV